MQAADMPPPLWGPPESDGLDEVFLWPLALLAEPSCFAALDGPPCVAGKDWRAGRLCLWCKHLHARACELHLYQPAAHQQRMQPPIGLASAASELFSGHVFVL